MTYAEQQAAIDRAIEDLRTVADTISNPYLEDDLRKAIKSITHLSDKEMEQRGDYLLRF
jgi:hypothetical protein